MKISDSLLALIESMVNRMLRVDVDSYPILEELNGVTVALQLTELEDNLYIRFDDQRTRWFSEHNVEADLRLSTNIPALMQLSFGEPAAAGSIKIEGDQGLGEKVLALLARFELDWEEHLSNWVGDFPARKIGNLVRGTNTWGAKTRHSLGEMISNYLQEESRLLVPRWRVRDFGSDVHKVEKQVDALGNRLQRLIDNKH